MGLYLSSTRIGFSSRSIAIFRNADFYCCQSATDYLRYSSGSFYAFSTTRFYRGILLKKLDMKPILSIINVSKYFGGTTALDNFSLEIPKYGIIGIIGSNGAGKTTLFNVVTGFLSPDSGIINYNGI